MREILKCGKLHILPVATTLEELSLDLIKSTYPELFESPGKLGEPHLITIKPEVKLIQVVQHCYAAPKLPIMKEEALDKLIRW